MKTLELTPEILIRCGADAAGAERYCDLFNELLPYYQVDTLLRVAHFLGQLLHESDRFRAVHEYASGAAYEDRKDLGNVFPGDGKRYKGRAGIQLTGRANYAAATRRFGVDFINYPEKAEEPRWWVALSLYYWGTRALNLIADKDDVYQISCIINLGSVPRKNAKRQFPNGWDDRQKLVATCKRVLAGLI